LEAVCGVVTIVYLLISGVVGVRLLRLSSRAAARSQTRSGLQRPPELWLGLFFLLYACVASAMNVAIYASWADSALALPDLPTRLLHAGFFWVGGAGLVSLLIFLQQTFHPNDRWAKRLAWSLAGALLFASVLVGVTEGYAVRVLNGFWYWMQFVVRDLVFVWVATDSLRYWLRLRKRMQLGLAEPLLANRFFLMGAWGAVLAVLTWVDPVARVWYYLSSGSTTEWIPELGRSILLLNMSAATGLLAVAGMAILLAFFPTHRYRTWIHRRVQATSASASDR
jgi:hypothetical protein